MQVSEAPCRLFVYLARDAPLAAVLRRGPSEWARLSLWHTDTDEFDHGQWFHGRVYERRSDISADGDFFIYFALKIGRGRETNPNEQDSWIAISPPPRFTAEALWFVGGTYCAGGLFPAPRTVWAAALDRAPDEGQMPAGYKLSTAQELYIDRTPDWPERTAYTNRLMRDGWIPTHAGEREGWEHKHPAGSASLVMRETAFDFQTYGGPYVVEYSLRPAPNGPALDLGRATWADWDQQGRLVLGQNGRLLSVEPDMSFREIHDFNSQRPELS